jgi:hypothetical protein
MVVCGENLSLPPLTGLEEKITNITRKKIKMTRTLKKSIKKDKGKVYPHFFF